MNRRTCVKPPIDVYGIDAIIDTQMMKKPHIILVRLEDLENRRMPDIGTLNR